MSLHPKLIEYYQRFQIKNQTKQPPIDKFFTQLNLIEYTDKLPYFFNLENFCTRLLQAKINQEKICIYSDYDTDAVTATGAMYWGLVDLGFEKENITFYAPDRLTEGYGLNTTAIAKLASKYNLIITVDCGINSTEEAQICKNSKADLIITDHHQLTEQIPDCLAVINPVLGKIYTENSEKLKLAQNYSAFNSKKIQAWLDKMEKVKTSKNLNLASTSVTGVGVAWLAVVWLGYFLEEIEN
jgi:hypothetical protein